MHIYLDWKHDRFKGFGTATMKPIEYFFPYGQETEPRFAGIKKMCNWLYRAFLFFTVSYFLYAFITGTRITRK